MLKHLKNKLSIKAMVSCVPKNRQTTDDLMFDTQEEKNLFETKIGLLEKRNSNGNLTTFDLCCRAAKECLKIVNWLPQDIDMLLFVTQSNDYQVPGNSFLVQKALNLSPNIYLLDINAGCTGWVNGIFSAFCLMTSLNFKKALILNGDTSILSNPKDLSTMRIIGDAGCATAIEKSNESFKYHYLSQNHGELYESIIAKNSGARKIAVSKNTVLQPFVSMNGNNIFKFISNYLIQDVKEFFNNNEINQSVDYFVLHQANLLMCNYIESKLCIDKNKSLKSFKNFGNTSSASIPLSICLNKNINLKNKKVVFLAFGVGLAYSILYCNISSDFSSSLIEIN